MPAAGNPKNSVNSVNSVKPYVAASAAAEDNRRPAKAAKRRKKNYNMKKKTKEKRRERTPSAQKNEKKTTTTRPPRCGRPTSAKPTGFTEFFYRVFFLCVSPHLVSGNENRFRLISIVFFFFGLPRFPSTIPFLPSFFFILWRHYRVFSMGLFSVSFLPSFPGVRHRRR